MNIHEEQAKHRMWRQGKKPQVVMFFGDALNSTRLLLKLGEIKDLKTRGGEIGKYIYDSLDKPACEILPWIKQQIEENPTLMGEIIGEELTLEILRS